HGNLLAHADSLPCSTQDTMAMSAHLSPQTHRPVPSSFTDDPVSVAAVTPAPQRQHPRLAPSSATQLPSSYLQPTSSPAPFFGSWSTEGTPGRVGVLTPRKVVSSSPLLDEDDDEGSIVLGGGRARELGSPIKGQPLFLKPREDFTRP